MLLNKTFIPKSLTGDLRRGGYVLTGTIEGDTDAITYGQNLQLRGRSGADFLDEIPRVFFDGHVLAEPDNIQVGRYNTMANVQAGTMDNLLAGESLQDIGFTEQSSPANDHQITGLQLADIVQHILERHCNVIFNATTTPDGIITNTDIDTTGSVALDRYNVSKSSNIWRSIQNVGGGERTGEFYISFFDRKNKFFYQPFPAFWSVKPTSLGTLDKNHLRGAIRVRRNANKPGARVGQVNLTAVKDFDTVFTASFPTAPAEGKVLPSRDGIFAEDQTKTTTLATRLYQWLTRKYTLTIEVDPGLILFGDDGNGIDIANLITLDYDGPVEDAISGAGLDLNISDDYFIFKIQIKFDTAGKMAQGFLTLESDPT